MDREVNLFDALDAVGLSYTVIDENTKFPAHNALDFGGIRNEITMRLPLAIMSDSDKENLVFQILKGWYERAQLEGTLGELEDQRNVLRRMDDIASALKDALLSLRNIQKV